MKIKPSLIFLNQILVVLLPVTQAVFAAQFDTIDNIYKRLNAIQCDSVIKANEYNPNFVILDVRTPAEYSGYHISGAVNRSTGLTDFDVQLAALPKQKLYILHCQSGGRSSTVFTKMKNLGFAEVYEMIGGLNAWNAVKLPTTILIAPKLMLVSKSDIIQGINSDTIKIVITNRANGKLTFNSVFIDDPHLVKHNLNNNIEIEGSHDYSFSVFHSPKYSAIDSTKVKIESNGGNLEINMLFKNGIIQGIDATEMNEISLYPNPSTGKLYFKNITNSLIDDISVVNIAGKVILKQTEIWENESIDVSGLPNGIYIVRIKKGQQIISKKFVLKK